MIFFFETGGDRENPGGFVFYRVGRLMGFFYLFWFGGFRVRLLKETPYSQKEAEAAVGLGTDNGRRERGGDEGGGGGKGVEGEEGARTEMEG